MPIDIKREPRSEPPIEMIVTHPITSTRERTEKALVTIDLTDPYQGLGLYPARFTIVPTLPSGVRGHEHVNAAELRQIAEAATLAADELERRAR